MAIGTGTDMEGFIYGDGVNEHGVAISTYFEVIVHMAQHTKRTR